MTAPIDYANASYTRVYNEYQAELEVAGWQARALFWHIQTKMDRAGVFRFGALNMFGLIARRTGVPEEVVREQLPVLLDHGLLVVNGETLTDPEFVASQTTSKTNKQRQKDHRDKRRAEALTIPPTQQDLQLGGETRNQPLRVTAVTHGEERVSESEVNSSSEISEQPLGQLETNVVQMRPPTVTKPAEYGYEALKREFGELRQRAGGRPLVVAKSEVHLVQRVLRWARETYPADPRSACATSMKNYLASEWHGANGKWDFATWAFRPQKWFDSPPTPNVHKATPRFAPAPCSPRESFANYTNPDFVTEPLREAAE